jgi:hypothetical protein
VFGESGSFTRMAFMDLIFTFDLTPAGGVTGQDTG